MTEIEIDDNFNWIKIRYLQDSQSIIFNFFENEKDYWHDENCKISIEMPFPEWFKLHLIRKLTENIYIFIKKEIAKEKLKDPFELYNFIRDKIKESEK